ncbi:DUF1801 domain-containing protein [Alphaproteobacteria bacterium KMM 3653]|uniref:DUF1801 domain-containing protein n=1 Tax=Harenicola maris TaxID=2841044 RepID=A0AAP2CPZ8_9RHOB|nr:DUF1801 domain-containing protein [Harenicola maris]
MSAVEDALDALPEGAGALRALIAEVAAGLEDIGPLQEALRWGQPAYLTDIGSTLRIGALQDGSLALFAHCQSDVIARHAPLFPEAGVIEGNRAIRVGDVAGMADRLRPVIAYALRYHRAKTGG